MIHFSEYHELDTDCLDSETLESIQVDYFMLWKHSRWSETHFDENRSTFPISERQHKSINNFYRHECQYNVDILHEYSEKSCRSLLFEGIFRGDKVLCLSSFIYIIRAHTKIYVVFRCSGFSPYQMKSDAHLI